MNSYQDELDRNNMLKIKEILSELPIYVGDYFISRKTDTTTRTRLSYAYDLRRFFEWLKAAIPNLLDKTLKEIPIEVMQSVTARDIEEYTDYLQYDKENMNHRSGIARKLSALSSFFDYLYRNDLIVGNPCDKVKKPKPDKDNRIIRLSPDEVSRFLNAIEFGCSAFTPRQQKYLETTKIRDLAIATLLLGTGIRVSECVGLNIRDLDFDRCLISVYRKGGKYQYIAMGDEVIEALQRYLLQRKEIIPANDESADALFLSIQKTRICVQSIEDMIKKYAKAIGVSKIITPHKLRKTYGTELYQNTGDIYLVARALGHTSVNTTKNHYVTTDEESLINSRNVVKLRDK